MILALMLSTLAACKKGDIIERSVATQSGPTVLGIQPFTVLENSSNKMLFTLSRALERDVTFTWTISARTRPTTGRFSAVTGSVRIAAGVTATGVPIPLIDDSIYEGDVPYDLTLTDVTGEVELPVRTISFLLVDDELPPVVQFALSAQSKAEGGLSAPVTLRLSTASVDPITVTFVTSGTATRGDDYSVNPPGAVTFAPGETAKDLTVTLVDDRTPEPDETAIFTLVAVTTGRATIGATNPHTLTILNDDFNPVVLDVTSTAADGTYNAGHVPITVRFSRPVVVTGQPTLELVTTPTRRAAVFASGSGTGDLIFDYAIQLGDTAVDLDYASTAALTLAGGTIKAAGDTYDALLDLPSPATAHSLGGNKNIAIDTISPVVTSVSSSAADGAYRAGQVLALTVVFSKPVLVVGQPTLLLETGALDRAATFASGSGTTTLTFTYTVQSGDVSGDLDAQGASALTLNGGFIRDAANNDANLTVPIATAAGSLATNKALVIDTRSPTIAGVTSSLADGSYSVGTVVPIQVVFSERIFVTGSPRLGLETGATDRDAVFKGGSGTSVLTFEYTVQAGDDAHPLDYASTSAMALAGGSIVDGAGNAADLSLKSPGAARSLGAAKAIVIDTATPTVTQVTASTADGAYKAGSTIEILMLMTKPVIVVGTPQLTLETGANDRTANFYAGSGTSTLTFRYVVQAGDTALDLDYLSATALALNSGAVTDAAGNAADLTLADPGTAGSLGAAKNIVIDTNAPTITQVTATAANGSYSTGAILDVVVNFSETVIVTGTPRLTLKTGASATTAIDYRSGSGSAQLTFRYVVAAGDQTARLDYASTTSVQLNGAAIVDAATNSAVLTLPAPGAVNSLGASKNIVVDTAAPSVLNVSASTADGAYPAGSVIALTVLFSEVVYVTGSPTLALATLPTTRTAALAGGSGTNTLRFEYTVQAGDTAADLDYVDASSLVLNGGIIRDLAQNAAGLTLAAPGTAGSLGANKNLVVDTSAPQVTSVDSTSPSGSYRAGSTIDVVLHFSEIVVVTGVPKLTLETGTVKNAVNYSGGSGSTDLTFRYVVQAGESAQPLDYVSAAALALNGGSIRDVATNAASLALPAPGTVGSLSAAKTIVIDTTSPVVTDVTSTSADGYYTVGQSIDVSVTFSEAVLVTGSPVLTTSTNRAASFATGSGTSTLHFTYVVQAGDTSADLDYLSTTALALNGGTIADGAGNAATLTLAVPGATHSLGAYKTLIIDTTPPTVTSVSASQSDGAYTVGATLDIVVTFGEIVNVTGVPKLELTTGPSSTTRAAYVSGSGGTALTFRYVVASGDASADLDYASTAALQLDGGSIKDSALNSAVLTLATPGSATSLGANRNIVVDTTAPTVLTVSSTTGDGTYKAGTTIRITVQFSETVFVTNSPTLLLATGATNRSANYATGSGTATLSFDYVVQAGDTSSDLNYVATTSLDLGSATIRDFATNAAVTTLPALASTDSLAGAKNIVVDTTAPQVAYVDASTTDGFYTTNATINVITHFSESVFVTGSPTLTVNTTPSTRALAYAGGSGSSDLTFTFTVQSGDTAADLDVAGTSALALAGGTIRDLAGNDGTLTLPVPGSATSLGARRGLVIDTTAPTAPGAVDDGTWTTSLAQSPAVTWGASTDATSGIGRYEVSVGTSAGGLETLGWTSVGVTTTATPSGLSLTEGTRYFASLRAVDRAGNISGVTSGDGFRPDVTPPTAPASMADGVTSSSVTATPSLSWTAASDGLSGLAGYQVALGTTFGGTDTLGWTSVGNVLTTTRSLALVEGASYFASVRAVDVAGNLGAPANADGWIIGWLQEAFFKATASAASFAQGSSIAISGDTMVVGSLAGKGSVSVYVRNGASWSQQASLSDGNGQTGDNFGKSVAIDGDTLVIGAPNDAGNGTAIATTTPLLRFGSGNGAAHIYVRSGTTWTLQAYAKASNGASNDLYGSSVAISGNTVVVGAVGESSNATGASPTSNSNNSSSGSGAAYVLTRSGSTWTEQAYLKAATSKAGVKFGSAVAISGDTAAIGAPADNTPVTGIINGTGGSNAAGGTGSGAVYTFLRSGTTWQQQAYIKASNAAVNDALGTAVAISGDVVVAGAPAQASAGAAYVFARAGVTWSQAQILKPNNLDAGDAFGSAVAIDGSLLLAGSPAEASAQTTVGQIASSSTDNSAAGAGAAYLFRLSGTWSQLAYLKAPNAGTGDAFGTAVGISGSSLAVGAPNEDANVKIVTNGKDAPADNSLSNSGAAYLFRR